MNDKEKKFIETVNIDKARNKTKICIVLSSISMLTYVLPLIYGDFDFGIVFEVLTFVFMLLARHFMANYDGDAARKCVILAMIPIGWLFIYDLITVVSFISDIFDFTFLGIDFSVQEGLTVFVLAILFGINMDLRKADNPEKYQESTDWFYERPDDEDNENEDKNV